MAARGAERRSVQSAFRSRFWHSEKVVVLQALKNPILTIKVCCKGMADKSNIFYSGAAHGAERHRSTFVETGGGTRRGTPQNSRPTTVETRGRARLCALFASTFFQTSVGVSRCDARRRVSSLSAGVSGFPIGPHMRLPWVKARTRWGLSGEARVTGPSLRQDAPCYTYLPHGGLATPKYLQQACT